MQIKLLRHRTGPLGTFGLMLINNEVFSTLEPKWLNNQKDISCIPEGLYPCKKIPTPNHGLCWSVLDVEGRETILFHVGNTIKDTKGCILIGMEHDFTWGIIFKSLIGYKKFNKLLTNEDGFSILIIDCF